MRRLHLPLAVVLAWSIAVLDFANQDALAQFRGRRDDEVKVAENRPTERPKAMIALSIWILKLSESHEEADAELTVRIAAQAENLSPMVGSVSEVRELVKRMRVAGLLQSERELRMVALDGQQVTAQIGRNQPRIVATASDPAHGRMNSIKYEETGVLINASPQIDTEDFIQVSVEIGESDTEKSTDVAISMPLEGAPLYADVVTMRQFNTTARTKSGEAVVLKNDAVHESKDPAQDTTELIILGAAIVEEQD
jgi:hypothetical protein